MGGPLFISVGTSEQLRQFLEVNPELEGCPALVDDSEDFAAYRGAGFNYLIGDKVLTSPPQMVPPTMGVGKWFKYLANVASLSPMPKGGISFGQVPPGVKVLGGTYAIDGEDVVFGHMDEVPGATPAIDDVMSAVGLR